MAAPAEVPERIERYLETVPSAGAAVEVGFFGGTFTGLPMELQDSFLGPVRKYIDSGRIRGIRLSTRPDFINEDILTFLKGRGVVCIELGVQSMSDRVLSAAKRGHTAEDTERASRMITRAGFMLGHQMMLGLPSSSADDEYFTARRAKELGAAQVRIYPVLVMKGTELARQMDDNRYVPLAEEEAVLRCARLILYFESRGIRVIRCGLHPSEGLLSGDDLAAGPFHQAFRLKAEGRIFSFMLDHVSREAAREDNVIYLSFNPKDEAGIFGFERENFSKIERICGRDRDRFRRDEDIPRGCLLIAEKGRMFLLDRKTIADSVLPECLRD